jgi:hypothetical protein
MNEGLGGDGRHHADGDSNGSPRPRGEELVGGGDNYRRRFAPPWAPSITVQMRVPSS